MISVRLSVLCVVLWWAIPASAAEYFVAVNGGDDARSCGAATNINLPKRTLNNARGCLAAGDTLSIRGGLYVEALIWHGGPKGTAWTNPITIRSYQNEPVTIRPATGQEFALNLSNSASGVDNGSQYLVFDSVTFDGRFATFDVVKVTEWDGLQLSTGGFPA